MIVDWKIAYLSNGFLLVKRSSPGISSASSTCLCHKDALFFFLFVFSFQKFFRLLQSCAARFVFQWSGLHYNKNSGFQ